MQEKEYFRLKIRHLYAQDILGTVGDRNMSCQDLESVIYSTPFILSRSLAFIPNVAGAQRRQMNEQSESNSSLATNGTTIHRVDRGLQDKKDNFLELS
ncbi:hypothetical protein TNIN_325391 [Trichonephila inaurata madagascariensis]|uniref:Uncharacterized protein n=1 Tax=Trichonephila inaurata madagascariensis TaxID=2747483 RepID=A0A8X6YXZ5_9ARAC|nr:hypothetical protein TNIN_325391 [Trichonephila inaurata madagascariensis]